MDSMSSSISHSLITEANALPATSAMQIGAGLQNASAPLSLTSAVRAVQSIALGGAIVTHRMDFKKSEGNRVFPEGVYLSTVQQFPLP